MAAVTARVAKAEAAFEKAQQVKAKLLRSLQEADDRIQLTAEELATAEDARLKLFREVLPPTERNNNSPPPAATTARHISMSSPFRPHLRRQ